LVYCLRGEVMNLSEHQEQSALIKWFDLQYKEHSGRLFAIPNGAHLSGTVSQRSAKMNKMKADGLRVGVPDLFLPVPTKDFHGLFIEMKRKKGSKTSVEQIDWLNYLARNGYATGLCCGFEAAKDTIESYLK
jgi:hypothetical protein